MITDDKKSILERVDFYSFDLTQQDFAVTLAGRQARSTNWQLLESYVLDP